MSDGSVNEELTTLNLELREKIEELGRTNSDLQNLMASTRIGTLFLERNLRLKRYTSSVQDLFNIIPGDLGRPLAHITHQLSYTHLIEDAERTRFNNAAVSRELRIVELKTEVNDLRKRLDESEPYRVDFENGGHQGDG
jgi:two-component system CheB/CheR fusion protein